MKVQFSNVGRRKVSWEAELKTFDWDSLYKQVKSRGELLSTDIDFPFDEETGEGEVWAGGVTVGQFKIVKETGEQPNE